MADIQVESNAYTLLYQRQNARSLVWTTNLIGYIFYIDSLNDLVYKKSTDGGSTWGTKTTVKAGTVPKFSIWFDKWTNGDTGTKIHITYLETGLDDFLYKSLDTSTDSLSTEVTIATHSTLSTGNWANGCVSIVKSRGGNLYMGGWGDVGGSNGFYRSTDGGSNWTSRTNMADGNDPDLILFEPGAETDNNDIWCIYWDTSHNEVSLKVYDNSLNSWSETTISGGSMTATDSLDYFQMDSCTRHSDNKTILSYWDNIDNVNAILHVFVIGGSSDIVEKTSLLFQANAAQVGCFINQKNDDIYISYLKGSNWGSLVDVRYQKSTDGGVNWGTETIFNEDTNDDLRVVCGGYCALSSTGGRFQPVWFNDDFNDLMTNTNNAVVITSGTDFTHTDTSTMSLTSSSTNYTTKDVSTGLNLTESNLFLGTFFRTITSGITISDSNFYQLNKDFQENLGIVDDLLTTFIKNLNGSLSLSDITQKDTTKLFSQNLNLSDGDVKNVNRTFSNPLSIGDLKSNKPIKEFSGLFSLTDNLLNQINKFLSDNLNLNETISKDITDLISESLGLSSTSSMKTIREINESINLVGTLLKQLTFIKSLVETLNLTSGISKLTNLLNTSNIFLSDGDIKDSSINLSNTISTSSSQNLKPTKELSDTLNLIDSINKVLSAIRTISQNLNLSETQANSLLRGILEGLSLSDIHTLGIKKQLTESTILSTSKLLKTDKSISENLNLSDGDVKNIIRTFAVGLNMLGVESMAFVRSLLETISLGPVLSKDIQRGLSTTLNISSVQELLVSKTFSTLINLSDGDIRVFTGMFLEGLNLGEDQIKDISKQLTSPITLTDLIINFLPEKIKKKLITSASILKSNLSTPRIIKLEIKENMGVSSNVGESDEIISEKDTKTIKPKLDVKRIT